MASKDRPAAPTPPPPILGNQAWFEAAMGSDATATVAALQPGRIGFLCAFADVTSSIVLGVSIIAFLALVVRNFLARGLGRRLVANVRSPRTGPADVTIPGAVNVLAIGFSGCGRPPRAGAGGGAAHTTRRWWWPATARELVAAGHPGRRRHRLGSCLTVAFFVGAFEHEHLQAEDISGTWFIPEPVVLL